MPTLCAGLDVSLELTSIWVITADGSILKESKVAGDPPGGYQFDADRAGWPYEPVGLEASPLSQWPSSPIFTIRSCQGWRHCEMAEASDALAET